MLNQPHNRPQILEKPTHVYGFNDGSNASQFRVERESAAAGCQRHVSWQHSGTFQHFRLNEVHARSARHAAYLNAYA